MKSGPLRVDIERVPATGERWWRISRAFVTIDRARDPEHEVARELLALGVTGKMQTFVAGKAERVIDSREAASEPARVLAIQRVKAQKRIEAAKEAKAATTSPRIEEAIAAKQRAEASVTSEAAKRAVPRIVVRSCSRP